MDQPGRRSCVEIGDAVVPDGVTVGRSGRRLSLRAARPLTGLATGRFADPSVAIELSLDPLRTGVSSPPQLLGFALTQFAMPVWAGPSLDFDFHPAPNLHSPPAVGVLLVRSGEHTTLVAPIDNPHEQVISVLGGRLRWGWHGDLDEVPADFETTVGIYDGRTASEVFAAWADDVRRDAPSRRWSLAEHPLTAHLSYWTDNGAAYWYRTEPGRSITRSVGDTLRELRALGVPVRAVELDSWFYPHETLRPIAEIGYPAEVPPTGMSTWVPRPDAFDTDVDGDPLAAWAHTVGDPPLVLHARHIGPASPYRDEGEWWDDALAIHPTDPAFFRRWFDDARRWGACCIEQDWMLMYWFGVRALRSTAGRARAWQEALDRHAADTGVGLMWCMAMPADLVLAAQLPHVVAVRTSDDYRFADDPATLWIWFLTVNRLAGSLGLPAFKDVFFSRVSQPGDDGIDGDPHAEFEALLAALSAGPVGIGDRVGRTDASVVMRTCNEDGSLRHVDRPVALIDDCLFGAPARGDRLAWATTTSTVDGDVWTYVLAVNVADQDTTDQLPLAEIGLVGERSVLDWRSGRLHVTDRLDAQLSSRDWSYWVIAPPHRRADEGDTRRYVTMSQG